MAILDPTLTGGGAMRRSVVALCFAAIVIGGGVWAVAAAGSSREDASPSTPLISGLQRATRSYGAGPSAEYDFDSGSIGVVTPLRLRFPSGTSYDVVVTVSLDYRTSADDRFVVGLLVRRDSEFGHRMPVTPPQRAIAGSTVRTSSTAVFRLVGLPGGHAYWFSPTVNVSQRVGNHASIGSSRVLLVVDATPSG
jgi:hypothetical protein